MLSDDEWVDCAEHNPFTCPGFEPHQHLARDIEARKKRWGFVHNHGREERECYERLQGDCRLKEYQATARELLALQAEVARLTKLLQKMKPLVTDSAMVERVARALESTDDHSCNEGEATPYLRMAHAVLAALGEGPRGSFGRSTERTRTLA